MTNNWKPFLPPFGKNKQDNFTGYAKTGKFIFQLGEWEGLTNISRPVEDTSSAEFRSKVLYLKKSLLKYRRLTGAGRGITAVQVGIPERFSVVYTGNAGFGESIDEKDLLIVINPVIIKVCDKKLLYPEMCMSAVPVVAPVPRPAWIEFEYLDEEGNIRHWDTKDDQDKGRMLNRVFQHEFDHMDGVINIFRVKDTRELFVESDPEFYKKARFQEVK